MQPQCWAAGAQHLPIESGGVFSSHTNRQHGTSNTEEHFGMPNLGMYAGSCRRSSQHLWLRAFRQHAAVEAGGGEAGGLGQ